MIQKAKFEYSRFSKDFNKGLGESDKKEGLLKRLRNIEEKNKEQLDETEYQGERQLDVIKNYSAKKESFKELEFSSEEGQKPKEISAKVREAYSKTDYKKLLCVHTNETEYNFNNFKKLKKFVYDIHFGRISIKQTKDKHSEVKKLIIQLKGYNSKNKDRKRSRSETLDNAERCYDGRELTIEAFGDGTFRLATKAQYNIQTEEKRRAALENFTKTIIKKNRWYKQ